MDTCTIETGLLRKHPCGETAVTKCANCEQALCAKHAVATMSAGKKTMLCPECAKAWKLQEKTLGAVPSAPAAAPAAAKKPAEAPKAAAHKPPPAPPKPAPAPASVPKPVPAKPDLSIEHTGSLDIKPAAPKPAAAPKPEDSGLEKKPDLSIDMTGPLEFTPSKKPEEKK